MLDGNTPKGVDEAYEGAAGSSNLRVGNDHTLQTPGDMIAAAGMNKHRMGLALLRLQTEWGSTGHPSPPTADDITTQARTYPTESALHTMHISLTQAQIDAAVAEIGGDPAKLRNVRWRASIEVPNPNVGKVRAVVRRPGAPEKEEFLLPLKLAKRERWDWYGHEIKLALMTMRTLPSVRDALLAHAAREDWGCDAHTVAEVLLWWLNPKCRECGGNREEVILGTGRTNGRVCRHCKGTGKERQGLPPAGREGMQLAGYINGCLAAARRELKEGAYRERRTVAGESARGTPLKRLKPKT